MNQGDVYERIVDLLNEAMLDDARWPEASALIDEAFGAKGSVLTYVDGFARDDIEIYLAKCYYRGEDRSAWQQEYSRRYASEDEHIPRLRQLPDSKIVAVADLFSEQERKTSRTYNDALVRFHGQQGLSVRLDAPRDSRIYWGIADPIDGDGWSSSQVDMIRSVLPHLRQYVLVSTALADAGALGRSAAELLDMSRAGLILLDRRGRILEANDVAAEFLRRNGSLSDQDGTLRTAVPEDNAKLQELLVRALPRYGELSASGSMMVRRTSRLPSLALHVKPVAKREAEYRAGSVAALVVIVDPASRARIQPGLLREAFGLTPSETEIAVLLAEGLTLRQIAATTNRGYGTVRGHLKNIFAKLGISRQFELMQLVLALSSLPAARD